MESQHVHAPDSSQNKAIHCALMCNLPAQFPSNRHTQHMFSCTSPLLSCAALLRRAVPYRPAARALTSFENRRTVEGFDASLTVKKAALQFLFTFAPVAYVGLAGACASVGCYASVGCAVR